MKHEQEKRSVLPKQHLRSASLEERRQNDALRIDESTFFTHKFS
jgi:hypothetical protein